MTSSRMTFASLRDRSLMPLALYLNLRAIEVGDVPRSGLDEIAEIDAKVVA